MIVHGLGAGGLARLMRQEHAALGDSSWLLHGPEGAITDDAAGQGNEASVYLPVLSPLRYAAE